MKLQNTFSRGIVDKDSQERFVDSDELIDAENFFVTTVDSSDMGVGRNALGNALKTAYNIVGGKTIGHGIDNTNNFIYNFIKGTSFDYIIEYNTETLNSQIVLQSTTGTRLNFKTGERILNVDVIFSDRPYDPVTNQGGNLLKFSGDSNPPRIININRSKTWGTNGFTADEIMLIKAPPLYPPSVFQTNTLTNNQNFMKDKFISFAYRYKYKDEYYSAISAGQEYSFTPGKFELDFASFDNKGMLNIFNACEVSFNTGPREVIAIDVLFRESNNTIFYLIDQYVKEDENWTDDSIRKIQFDNSKVFTPLPEDQFYRICDYIPDSCVAATVASNRAFIANFKQGHDLIDKNGNKVVMDYTLSLVTNDFNSSNVITTPLNAFSPFDSSIVLKGKLRFDFTSAILTSGAVIYLTFNIKGSYTTGTPPDTEDLFMNTYNFILDKDYSNIQELVTDPNNGFITNLENYFSEYLRTTSLQIPNNTIIPYDFRGFILGIENPNVIDITLPAVRYTINNSPAPNTIIDEYFRDVATVASSSTLGSKKSMKSYRSYEACMVYFDSKNRPTTALTSANNTIFIPVKNSITQNIINVLIPTTQKPPIGFGTYRFGIKENRGPYEEIYASIFYKDGIYRWIRLDGGNKNKVNENDMLLVKKDISNSISNVVQTKVLEIRYQEEDFLTNNKDENGNLIIESAGTYMKIKPENFSIDYSPDEFVYLEDNTSVKNNRPFSFLGGDAFSAPQGTDPETYVDVPISQGSEIVINLHSDYHRDSEQNNYSKTFIVNDNYDNFTDYYNAELAGISFIGDSGAEFKKEIVTVNGQIFLKIEGTAAGNGTTRRGFLDANLQLRSVSGYFIFETLGKEVENNVFFLTPDVFTISNGEHQLTNHLLTKTFNCYVQGNGAESHQIRDAFNEKYISIDFAPTAVNKDGYREENRYADITYSGIFNSSTNINRLNEFNLFTANFKDDIDKSYGPIYKIKGIETNLQVFQEDKDSFVYYGKDMLYNADGSSNLARIDQVLGLQDLYIGEYGISEHPESFDIYGGTVYHTDVKRGVVLKKVNNGLFEISSQKMTGYFKKLFRDNTINQIIAKYDQYHDVYVLNIKYNNTEYVTWIYSDSDNGWLGRITFNPEDMCRVNTKFFSFHNGEIYEHNQSTGRNTFYGVEYPSKFVINFSQNPSERKIYKNIEFEGTDSWEVDLITDLETGFINKLDFVKQEGVFRAYVRTSNDVIDNSSLTVQGIGNCTISGLNLIFAFALEDDISIGDKIMTIDNQLVGTIQNKGEKSLTLDEINNIVSGDYVMCAKSKSSESRGLLGYHMQVSGEIMKNTKTELYACNSEVIKSYV